MLRTLLSTVFYARFAKRFSTKGLHERAAGWAPFTPRLTGQTWLVTGATGGIGRAIALGVAAAGATVIGCARRAELLDALVRDCAGPGRVEPAQVDLALTRDVAALAARLVSEGRRIDVLVNNVGVLLPAHSTTAEGVETSFATNLLNHWLLTTRLQAGGVLARDGAVINMSSGGMYGVPLDLAALERDAKSHDGMAAYAAHKRAQVALARHWRATWPKGPVAYAMHPGWVDTEGVKSALPGFRAFFRRVLRDAEQGADTAIWLGAARPPQPVEGGIWLDRVLDEEHAFAYTRREQPTPADLAAFLEARLARLGIAPAA
jgi:dehydrogenase/reductase SDR family protein 12